MLRNKYLDDILQAFDVHQVVALLGPRQCGKTTLAKQYLQERESTAAQNIFDCEQPSSLARLQNPELALSELEGLIVIDEIQLVPELFSVLRVLVDNNPSQKFLILGSASRDLIRQSAQTLAGRVQYIEIMPFSLNEVGELKKLWWRGGFPRAYLNANDKAARQWLLSYIRTYLERDIPNLGFNIPAHSMRKFWLMLTHVHGNILNASELGRSLGIADTTVKRYLDILSGTFMVRQLQPWHENINKRQVKAPKIYFRDSGIYHVLLDVPDADSLQLHPKLGASWEGFALEEVIKAHHASVEECYFWSVHQQCELDLLIVKDGKRYGYEFKYSDKPTVTKSMNKVLELLKLDNLTVIYPGKHEFSLTDTIRVKSLSAMA